MQDIELEIYNILNEIKMTTKSVLSNKNTFIIKESSKIQYQKPAPQLSKTLLDLGIKDVKPLSPNQKKFIKEKNKIQSGPNESVFQTILSCVDGTETAVPGSLVQDAAIELYDGKTVEAKFTQKNLNSFIQEEKAKQVSDVEGEVKPSKVLACLYYSEIETFKKAYNDYFKVGKPIPSLKDFYNQTNGQCLSYSLAQINSTPLGCTTAFYMDSGIFEATQGGSKEKEVMTLVALTYGSWFVYDNGYNSYINWKTKLDNYIEQQTNTTSSSTELNQQPRTREDAEKQSEERRQNVDRGLGQIKMVQNKDGDNATFSFQYFEASDDEKKRVFMNEFMSQNIIPELLTPWDAISNRNYVGSYKEKIRKVDLADFSTVEQVGNVQNTRLPSGDLKMEQTSAIDFTKLQPLTDDELKNVQNSKVTEDGSVIRTVNGKKEVVTDPYCLKKGETYVNLRSSPEVDMDFSENTMFDPSGGGNFIKWTGQQIIGNWTGSYILKYLPIFKTWISQDVYGDKWIYVGRIVDGDSRKNFFSEIDKSNLGSPGSVSRSRNRVGKETGYFNGDCIGKGGGLYCGGQFDNMADLAIAGSTNLVQHEYNGPAAKWGFENGEKLKSKQIWDIALRTGVAKYWLEIEIPKEELYSNLARLNVANGGENIITKFCQDGEICKVWVAAKYVEPCRTGSKQETRNFADFTGDVELKTALSYNLDDEGNLVIFRSKYVGDEIKNWKEWCKNQKNNKFAKAIYDCSKADTGDINRLEEEWTEICSSEKSEKLTKDKIKWASPTLEEKLKKFVGKKVRCKDDNSEHTNNFSEVFKNYPTLLFDVPTSSTSSSSSNKNQYIGNDPNFYNSPKY